MFSLKQETCPYKFPWSSGIESKDKEFQESGQNSKQDHSGQRLKRVHIQTCCVDMIMSSTSFLVLIVLSSDLSQSHPPERMSCKGQPEQRDPPEPLQALWTWSPHWSWSQVPWSLLCRGFPRLTIATQAQRPPTSVWESFIVSGYTDSSQVPHLF